MKYISIFVLLILMNIVTYSQETDASKRNISLLILDKRGRPVNHVLVRSLSAAKAGITNNKGLFVFTGMTDNDTVSMILPKFGEAFIPVAGMDSLVVKLRSARRFYYMYNDEMQSVMIDRRNKTEANTLIDAQALLKQHPYISLIDLLKGANVPGLNISSATSRAGGDASTIIRGVNSLTLSNEPLVVLDGLPIGDLNDANQMVNVNDIVTIEVQKNSSEWGVRAANGVILVNTK